MLPIGRERPSRKTSTVRKGLDREDQAILGWRGPSHPPGSWGTGRATAPPDRTAGHHGDEVATATERSGGQCQTRHAWLVSSNRESHILQVWERQRRRPRDRGRSGPQSVWREAADAVGRRRPVAPRPRAATALDPTPLPAARGPGPDPVGGHAPGGDTGHPRRPPRAAPPHPPRTEPLGRPSAGGATTRRVDCRHPAPARPRPGARHEWVDLARDAGGTPRRPAAIARAAATVSGHLVFTGQVP